MRFLFSLLFVCATFVPAPSTANDPSPIRALSFNAAPWGFLDAQGRPSGIVIEVLSEIASQLKRPAHLSVVPYARMLKELEGGRSDVSLFFRSKKSESISVPIAPIPIDIRTIVLPHKKLVTNNLDELSGLKVAFPRGLRLTDEFDNNKSILKEPVQDYETAMRMLKLKRVDAVAGSEPALMFLAQKLEMNADQDFSSPIVLGAKQGWIHLSKEAARQEDVEAWREAISRSHKNRLFEKIFAKYGVGSIKETAEDMHSVKVAAYPFPPFVSSDYESGITLDLLAELNDFQSEYQFTLIETSPNRRYHALKSGEADMILFEMPEWSWKKRDVQFDQTNVILIGGEVFIALRKRAQNQHFFDKIDDKHIAAVLGYHYAFAAYNSDSKYLRDKFRISLSTKPEQVISYIVEDKVDVGVVTKSYLQRYLKENPETALKLLISNKYDQRYRLRALVSKKAAISADDFEELFNELDATNRILPLLAKYDIEDQYVFRRDP